MAREAGARKVIFASCAPPITHPHIHGIDLASPTELIASDKDRFAIAETIGAEEVIYQDLDDLTAACVALTPANGPREFEVGVFCGKYVTGVPIGYFEHVEKVRRGKKTQKLLVSGTMQVASGGATLMAASQAQTAANGDWSRGSGQSTVPKELLNGELSPRFNVAEATVRDRQDVSMHNITSENSR